MAKVEKASGRGVLGLLSRAERFAAGRAPALGRVGGWTAALSSSIVAVVCAPALAGPEGARVVRGNVGIERLGNETVIRASDRSIINYRSFDIRSHETVRFIQPGPEARVMNRIESRYPTRIDGSLIANGRVYLVNPSGVIFGSTASVDVKGLVAAAGSISDRDFVRGIDRFTNLRGEVSNAGTLTADFVGLLGAQVSNSGRIVAPEGTVVMSAGRDVLVGERTGNIFVKVSGEAQAANGKAAVENTGRIEARKGRVRAAAGDVYGLALRVAGDVQAKDVRIEGQGRGEVHATGTIDATNDAGRGGEVRVLGEKVALSGATIDASGRDGAGTVLVGGNFQGKGPERNATHTFVSRTSTIKADGGLFGDGGTVIVWADQSTIFRGTVSAQGGELRGDGGFVEVSGKVGLGFHGEVNTLAPHGRIGTLLLDPTNIVVANNDVGGADANLSDDQILFADPGATLTISDESLEARTSNITLQATNDITFSQSVDMGAPDDVAITVRAGNNITVDSGVTLLTRGDISFTANDPGGTQTGTGSILMNGTIDTTENGFVGGDVSFTVSGGTGSITLAGNITTRGGTVTMSGPVLVSGSRTIDTGDGAANNTGLISFSSTVGNVAGGAADTLTLTAGAGTGRSAVSVSGAISGIEGLTISQATTLGTNGITMAGTGNISVDHSGLHTAGAAISTSGTYTQVAQTGASTTLNGLLSTGGVVTFNNAVTLNAGITTTNDNVFLQAATTVGATAEISAGSATIEMFDASIGNGFTLTLTADEIDFDGADDGIVGPGSLVARASTAGLETRISGAAAGGRLDVLNAEIAKVAGSVGTFTIGSATINGALNVNADTTFDGSATLVTGGQLTVDASITAATGTLRLHGGADGGTDAGGSVRFTGASRTLNAPAIQIDAGNQLGTSAADLITNTPSFRGAAGAGTSPTSFSFRQDAALTDAAIPAAAQFDNTPAGMTYAIESSGALTLSTASKVAGSALTLTGTTTTLSADLAVASARLVGTTLINLDGDIVTPGGLIRLTGNVEVGAPNIALDATNAGTSAGGANIEFLSGTIEGSTDATDDLFMNAGTGGTVSIGGSVGATTRLNTFQVTNAAVISTQAVRAVAITASSITSATFAGQLNATSGNIGLTSATINVNAGATTSAGGTFTATPGTLLSMTGGNLTLDGAFLKNGAGTTNLSSSITTTGDLIDFDTGTVTLTSNVALDATNGGTSAAGAGVEFAGTVNGAFNLTVNAGTGGAIVFTSAVGGTTRLNTFQITNGATLSTLGVRAVGITAGTGTSMTYGGLLDATTGNISLTSATINVNAGVTTASGGTFSANAGTLLALANTNLTLDGAFLKNGAGTTNIGVTIRTTGDLIDFDSGGVTLTANTALDTTNSGANVGGAGVEFAGTVNGAFDLTVNAGTGGAVVFSGAVGGSTRLNTFQITNGATLSTLGVRAVGITTGTVTSMTYGGLLDATSGNISLTSATINVNAGATTSTAGTFSANAGTLLALANTNLTLDGSFTKSGAGATNLGVAISTTGDAINFSAGNVTLTADGSLDTTSGGNAAGAAVSFAGTVNGAFNLFTAGGTGGAVTFSGSVGNSAALNTFQVTSSGTLSTGSVNAGTVNGSATTTATFGGLLTGGAGGITLSAATVNVQNGASTTGAMGVTAGTAFNATGAAISATGGFTKSGAGLSTIGVDISSGNANQTFLASSILFSADASLSAGTGTLQVQAIDLNGQDVGLFANTLTLGSTITGSALSTLRLGGATAATTIGVAGGAGDCQIEAVDLDQIADGAVGTLFIGRTGQSGAISILGGTFRDPVQLVTSGTLSTGGTITGDTADATITLQGSTINLAGLIRTTGTAIALNSPVVLTLTAALDTTHNASAAGAGVSFGSTIEGTAGGGTEDLFINAGTGGAVTVTGAAGGSVALGTFQVTDSGSVSTGAIGAGNLVVSSQGLVNHAGLLSIGAGGISITAPSVTLGAGATTTGGGGISITANSGAGAFTLNGAINSDGNFTKNGAAPNAINASIATTNDALAINAGATTFGADVTLNAGTSTLTIQAADINGRNVTFLANDFVFNAGANSITGTGLGSLRLGGATDATDMGIGGASGTAIVDVADLDALADEAFATLFIGRTGQSGAINIGGGTFRDAVQVVTTGTLSQTGTVTGDLADASVILQGSLVNLGGTVRTTGAAITVTGPAVLTASTTIDTTHNATPTGATITFSSTIDATAGGGEEDLSLNAGSGGSLNITGPIGGTAQLGTFTVVNASGVTLGALQTNVLIDVTVVGTGTFGTLSSGGIDLTGATLNLNGLATAGAGGISLAGGAANVNAGATTTGGGAFSATNTGTLAIANTALTLDGAFVRDGGVTTLGANITTTNDNITFTDGDDDVTLAGGARTLTAGTGTILFGGALAAGANALTLTGDGIDFTGGNNSVTGAGSQTITLISGTSSGSIGVAGGAGTLQITQGDLDAITDGAFASIDIGAASNTHAITIGASSYRDPTRFLAGGAGGTVTTTGAITGTTVDADLTFAGASNAVSNISTLGTLTITGGTNTAGGAGAAGITIVGSLNNLGGSLVTGGGAISLTGPVVLTGNALWDSTNAGASAAGANITTSAGIDGAFNLTLRAGTAGDITVGGLTGGVSRLADITVVSVADTTATFTGDVLADSFTQNAGSSSFGGILNVTNGVSLAGNTFTFAGDVEADSFTQTTGSSTFNGQLNVTNAIAIDGTTFAYNQAVSGGTFSQTSGSGAFAGTLTAGGAIVISGTTFTFGGAVTGTTFTQNSGASTFNGLLTTSAGGGVSITGSTISINAGITTTGGGGVTIVNSGQLTIANSNLSLNGAFDKTGAGATNLGANITTANANIGFGGGATTLTQNVTLSTGAGAGDVTFNSTIDGARTLQIGAGTGSVAFNAGVGGGTPLTSLVVTGATNVTALSTTTVTQNVGVTATGTVAFTGLVTAPTGFASSGGVFTQLGGITTTNSAISVNHAGAVTQGGALIAGSGAITITGSTISQNGTATGGTYTATGTDGIDIANDITATTVDIHAGTDGTGNLTFSAANIDVLATTIMLNAGDGTGGVGGAAVDLTTNAPAFRALAGGSTSPTTFVHEQDASISNALTALAAQFGNGPAGMSYTLCSNDGSVFITDASKVAGSNLTLCGLGTGGGCVDISTNLALGNLSIISPWCVSASVTIDGNLVELLGAGQTFANNVVFRAVELNLGGTVTGTGSLAFEPGSASQGVTLGGTASTGALDLTSAELAFLSNGYAALRFGRADGTGVVGTGGAVTLNDSTTFQSPGGQVRIEHALFGVGTTAFTFDGPAFLAANVTTMGGGMTFNDAVTVAAADVLVDSTDGGGTPLGGNILFLDTVNADAAANDRGLRVAAGGSVVDFRADVGGVEALGSLLVNAATNAQSIFVESVTTRGAQTYNGWLSTSGNLTSTVGGAILVNGNLQLENDLLIETAGLSSSDRIAVSGLTDGDGMSDWTLTLDAGLANAELLAAVGSTNAPASVIVTGGGIIVFDVTSAGGISLNGATFLNGDLTGVGVTVGGPLQVNVDSVISGSTFANLGGSVGSLANQARRLTINSPTTTIGGSVGGVAGTELGSLETDLAGVTTLGGSSYNVVDGLLFRDNVVLSGGSTVLFSALSTDSGNVNHGVVFGATLNAADSTARAVTVNTAAATRFRGSVGGMNALGSLTTNAGGFTLLGGNVTTTNVQSYGDNVTLENAAQLSASGVSFAGTVDSLDATPRALTITAPGGGVTFAQGVGATNALDSLSVTGSTIALRSVRTSNAQAYTGAATVEGVLRVENGGGITVTGPLTVLANSLLSSNSGGVSVTGATSITDSTIFSQDGGISITGATTLANATLDTDTGAITITGNVLLTGDADFLTQGNAADDVTVTGTIDSSGASHALTINAREDTMLPGGDVTLGGDAGLGAGLFALDTVTIAGNTISVRGVRSAGSQSYTGTTTLNGSLTATDAGGAVLLGGNTILGQTLTISTASGDVSFNGTVDHTGTPAGLTVTTGGANTVRFNGAVGGATDPSRLSSLTVTTAQGGVAIINAPTVRASGVVEFNSGVQLAQDATVAGSAATFARAVDSDATPRTLSVTSTGVTTFAGGVGQTGVLKRLTTDAGGSTRFQTNARTTHGMIFNDAVEVFGAVVLDGGGNDTSDDAGDSALPGRFRRMFFGEGISTGGSDGTADLTILTGFDPNGVIAPVGIEGDIGAANARFRSVSIRRSAQAGSANDGRASTVVFAPTFDASGRVLATGVNDTRNFTIFATENFTMGAGEKITAFGAFRVLRADSTGGDGRLTGTATIGDLVALGDITVRAASIRIAPRNSTSILEKQRDNGGGVVQNAAPVTAADDRVSIISGGSNAFIGFTTLTASDAPRVIFSSEGAAQGDLQGGFQIQDFQSGSDGIANGVTTALFVDEANASVLRPFDLRARGSVTETIATSIAGAIPRESATREVSTPPTVSQALREALQEMGIRVRDLSFNELIEFLVGWSTYRDLPNKPRPASTDYSVTANRLSLATVQAAVEAYRALLYTTTVGPDGQEISEKRTAELQETLGAAWDAYFESTDDPTGVGFRQYLESRGGEATPEEARALEILNAAREVFARLDALGLSSFEASFPKESLVGELLPQEMTSSEQLKEAIVGQQLAMF
ncbi:MAG: filamentous hemagglutinin N-terminal domain-containing protein [Planctomycetota bacterium]|nr:filamentous hemagglutinin N-terminal domain-containing protein [Planctomycetota bacterium]